MRASVNGTIVSRPVRRREQKVHVGLLQEAFCLVSTEWWAVVCVVKLLRGNCACCIIPHGHLDSVGNFPNFTLSGILENNTLQGPPGGTLGWDATNLPDAPFGLNNNFNLMRTP